MTQTPKECIEHIIDYYVEMYNKEVEEDEWYAAMDISKAIADLTVHIVCEEGKATLVVDAYTSGDSMHYVDAFLRWHPKSEETPQDVVLCELEYELQRYKKLFNGTRSSSYE